MELGSCLLLPSLSLFPLSSSNLLFFVSSTIVPAQIFGASLVQPALLHTGGTRAYGDYSLLLEASPSHSLLNSCSTSKDETPLVAITPRGPCLTLFPALCRLTPSLPWVLTVPWRALAMLLPQFPGLSPPVGSHLSIFLEFGLQLSQGLHFSPLPTSCRIKSGCASTLGCTYHVQFPCCVVRANSVYIARLHTPRTRLFGLLLPQHFLQ